MEKSSLVVAYMLRCYRSHSDNALRVYLRQVLTGEEKYCNSLEEATIYIKRQLTEAEKPE